MRKYFISFTYLNLGGSTVLAERVITAYESSEKLAEEKQKFKEPGYPYMAIPAYPVIEYLAEVKEYLFGELLQEKHTTVATVLNINTINPL